MNFIQEEGRDLKNIFNRFKRKDFSGNTGQAIKNSSYHFGTVFIGKIMALIFTAILARILMPELFGLYSLTLGTIFIFSSFSNLGLDSAIIKFISSSLGKNNPSDAKAYINYLLKIKIYLVLIFSFILLVLAKFLAITYYQKPIFLGLILGPAIIIFLGIISFLESTLRASNNFRIIFFKEAFFQSTRIIMVLFVFFTLVKFSSSISKSLFLIILSISLAYILTAILLFLLSKKELLLKVKKKSLKNREKRTVLKFIFPLSLVILSTLLYGYVDMFMLGHFVEAPFIGFYGGAILVVSSIYALTSFAIVFLPIFSRLKLSALERSFKKTKRITFTISIVLFIGTFIFAPMIIRIIFGEAYASATPILRILSFLLICNPLNALYDTYFTAKGKTVLLAKWYVFSMFFNIILNYFLITWLLKYGSLPAVLGASVATLISRYFLLGGLTYFKKRN